MCIYKRKYIDLLVYSLTSLSGIKKKLIIIFFLFFLIIYVFVFYLICIKIKICMQK